MGTNYYARQVCGDQTEQHIGKASAGWVFAVRWMEEHEAEIAPVTNDEELRALIFGESIHVFDEYGRERAASDLWNDIKVRAAEGLSRTVEQADTYRGLRTKSTQLADYLGYEFE